MVRKTWALAALVSASLGMAAFAEEPKRPRPEASKVQVEAPREAGEPAKVKTRVGTFEVSPKNADLLERVLAGDKAASGVIYAGGADL